MAAITQRIFCYRFFCLMGGLFGAAGIAAFAAAKHMGGYYDSFAPILLGNAPIFLIIGLNRITAYLPRIAGLLIFSGSLLFTASLLVLQHTGQPLFHFSAPIGGVMIIIGWLLFMPCGFINIRNTDK